MTESDPNEWIVESACRRETFEKCSASGRFKFKEDDPPQVD